MAFSEIARTGTIETRRSWLVAWLALGILCVSLGAPLITVVALKPIAAEFGNIRSVPALCYSLAWLGSAAGGIAMGLVADRVGVRWTVIFGAVMIAGGLVLSSFGGRIELYLGHGLFMGLLGNAGINAPLYVYVARWFDRRRGTALALIASGQAAAGTVLAPVFGHAIGWFGWRSTMRIYAALAVVVIVPVAFLIFRQLPRAVSGVEGWHGPVSGAPVLGLRPNTAFVLLCLASFLCCVPMAMPQGHLVAFCSDLGIPVTRGSAMLSVLLAFGFMGRQLWGFIADRVGGLRTVLAGSACQLVTITGFLLTQDEAGLFVVAAAFGLGFSGIIPAYVLALRELYPVSEAPWRVPSLLLFSGSGMAAGGWLAGVIYDYVGFYAVAFAAGIIANLANLAIIGTLAFRQVASRPLCSPAEKLSKRCDRDRETKEERMRGLILGAVLSAVAAPTLAAEFMLASTEVKSGSPMGLAQVFTACKGQNISPALSWSGEPTGTQGFAVTMYDPDARAGAGWWHWILFNIPATVHSLAAGVGTEGSRDLPAGAAQGRNDFGLSQYSGPCPPAGDHAHHYEITVYALRVSRLPLDITASGGAVSSQLRSNTLATAKIVGRYERSN